MTKPFNAGEMLARIRAVMRRLVPQNEKTLYRAGKLSIDIAKHSVEVQRRAVHLTPTEYDVLKILVMNAGKISHEIAESLVLKEYDEYRKIQDKNYISDFDLEVKKLLKK